MTTAPGYRSAESTHRGRGYPRGPLGHIDDTDRPAAIGFCPLCGTNARRTCSARGMFECPTCGRPWYDPRVGEQPTSFEDYFTNV